jgi:hypothetical protein
MIIKLNMTSDKAPPKDGSTIIAFFKSQEGICESIEAYTVEYDINRKYWHIYPKVANLYLKETEPIAWINLRKLNSNVLEEDKIYLEPDSKLKGAKLARQFLQDALEKKLGTTLEKALLTRAECLSNTLDVRYYSEMIDVCNMKIRELEQERKNEC